MHNRKYAKEYIMLLTTLTIFIFFFAYQITHNPGASRLSEIATPGANANQTVDAIRKSSLAHPLLPVFENKLTVTIDTMLQNVFTIFSPEYLFLHGDYFASLGKYGLFYPLDLIFLLIGGGWLFAHKKKVLIFFIPLILLSVIPHLIRYSKDGENFTPHITLLFPFFIILMGAGLWQLFHLFKHKLQYVVSASIVLVYAFSIGNFLSIYFYQMPLQADYFNFSNRLLSQYISLSQNNDRIVVHASNPENMFKDYIFYNKLLNKDTVTPIKNALHERKYFIGNVTFVSCDKGVKELSKNIVITQAQCGMSLPNAHLKISQLSDSGTTFQIYNDKTCNTHQLNGYISNLKIDDFALNQSKQAFCTTFITK
jgi:hypothetical protein